MRRPRAAPVPVQWPAWRRAGRARRRACVDPWRVSGELRSKAELEPGEEDTLVGSSLAEAAEGGDLVVDEQPRLPLQGPVHPDTPGTGALDGRGRRPGREAVGVGVERRVTGHQREGAATALRGVV